MNTTRAAAAVAGIGLILSLAACSSSDDLAETNAQYCEGAEQVQSELDKLGSLVVSGASTDALKQQRDFVQSAIQANSVPLAQLTQSVQTEIETAHDTLIDSLEAVPDEATPSEVATAYQAAIEEYESSVSDVESELGCT